MRLAHRSNTAFLLQETPLNRPAEKRAKQVARAGEAKRIIDFDLAGAHGQQTSATTYVCMYCGGRGVPASH